ncbi:MAG: pyrroline-5-carboxylate reductase [Verrucomicrobia bacterium]|nr:pyrroline-5-carboxylate reductase [Verrucomicrobiota bacterium]MDA1066445.1 pyrroline-5-carboxylate reductase [Verrucomicrobiota bacterium]
MSVSSKIGFWGSGNMASAMMRGLISKQVVKPEQIYCISEFGRGAGAFAKETGANSLGNSSEDLIEASDILVLAFKPQQLDTQAEAVQKINNRLVLSILAGTSLEKLARAIPNAGTLVRTMPNTPGRISEGITAYCSNKTLEDSDKEILKAVLGSLGQVFQIDESMMDVHTAVAGSGPAYVFEFIAALAEAGTQEGLPPEMALQIAKQTVFGAAALAKQAEEHPEELRNQVTSKGGTTQAGLEAMSSANFREMIRDTVRAAKLRSIEMGK